MGDIKIGNGGNAFDQLKQQLAAQAKAREAEELKKFEEKARAEAAEKQAKLAADQAHVTDGAAQVGPTGAQAIAPSPDGLPPVLDANHASLAGQPDDVKAAVATLTRLSDGLAGSPAERAAAIAEALASDPPLDQQLGKLHGLPPELQQLADEEVATLKQAATPQELTRLLAGQVDFKDLPPDAVNQLARLAGTTQDADLRGQLGALGAEAMSAGALSADALQAHPELGQFLLINKDAPDDALRGQVQDTFRTVVNQVLDRQIGAGNAFGFEDLGKLKAAADDLNALAKAAGLQDAMGPATKQVADVRFPHGGGGFGDFVSDVADVAGNAGGTVLHAGASVVDTAGQGIGAATEGAANVAADGLEAVHLDAQADAVREKGKDVADGVRDKTDKASAALDVAGSLAEGGVTGAANDLADHLMGTGQIPAFKDQVDGFTGLITNRLDRGDSVFINATVSADVKAGAVIGAEANGKGAEASAGEEASASLTGGATLARDPDGKLSLTLELGGQAELKEKAGAEGNIGVAKASVEAKAGFAAEGKGKITLTFDPTKPDDVARLKALTEPQNVLAGATPIGAVTITGPAFKDAMDHNLSSTELSGQAGVEARGTVKASVGSLTAKAGLEANATLGEKVKTNRDGTQETTVFVRGGISDSFGVSEEHTGAGASVGVGANGALGLTVKTDASGQIIGISGEADGDLGVDVGSHTTTTVTHTLTPAGLAEANKRIAAGDSPLAAFLALQDQPGMASASKRSTDTDDVSLDLSGGLALGVGADFAIDITVGHSTSRVEQLDPPASSLEQDVVQGKR
jgi:hypothetical protein